MKNIQYRIEALILHLLFFIFGAMPVDWASAVGGWIGRTAGPCLGASRKAARHLREALPRLPLEKQEAVIYEMWENLGRLIAEYPHIETIARHRTRIEGGHILASVFQEDSGGVFIGAHQGNWEINGATLPFQHGKPLDLTYRALNNPHADKLLERFRTLNARLHAYPKASKSGKALMQALKDKRYIGFLIDQKYNEGIAAPFFHHTAMTNPVFAQLCQKFDCPLIPVRNQRLKGAHFLLTVHEPIPVRTQTGEMRPIEDVISDAHRLLEGWISEKPGQWLWLHRRWGSKI